MYKKYILGVEMNTVQFVNFNQERVLTLLSKLIAEKDTVIKVQKERCHGMDNKCSTSVSNNVVD